MKKSIEKDEFRKQKSKMDLDIARKELKEILDNKLVKSKSDIETILEKTESNFLKTELKDFLDAVRVELKSSCDQKIHCYNSKNLLVVHEFYLHFSKIYDRIEDSL